MDHVKGLKCTVCGRQYSVLQIMYTCPECGGTVDVVYDYKSIKEYLNREALAKRTDWSMWRYIELLPVASRVHAPHLRVGWTPLYHAQRLGQVLGLSNLYIKDDTGNPTASFKDRASTIAVVKARELGFDTVACASSGNAAASLAGLCAAAGLKSVVFVPEGCPRGKIAQFMIYGATAIVVRGTYIQAFELSTHAVDSFGWYNRNSGVNPYLTEGKKTAALEVCEQLDWHPPDHFFVAVGDGCIIGSIWKGLKDLHALGIIDRLPKVSGVQAEGCAPLVTAWRNGTEEIMAIVPHTIADGIAAGYPHDGTKALHAVKESGGQFLAVSDDEILEAMHLLGQQSGVFAEPSGAAGLAGLMKLSRQGRIDPSETIVIMVTGNGLKDPSSAIKAAGEPYTIDPTIGDLEQLVARLQN